MKKSLKRLLLGNSTIKKTLSKHVHSQSAKIFHEAEVPSRSMAGEYKIVMSIGKIASLGQ